MKQRCIALFIFVITIGLSAPLGALTVVQLNLLQLSQMAPTIFRGECTSVDRTIRQGRDVLVVTFKVNEVIKGDAGSTVTFTQIAPPDPSAKEIGLGSAFEGVPTYQVGEECVIFLSKAASSGLTAPVGLGQGRFCVALDEEGQRIIRNDIHNQGLFRGMKGAATLKTKGLSAQDSYLIHKAPKKIHYGDFVPLVKKLANE